MMKNMPNTVVRVSDGLHETLSAGENAFANAIIELPKYMRSLVGPDIGRVKDSFLIKVTEYKDYFDEQDKAYGAEASNIKTVSSSNTVPGTAESITCALKVYEDIMCDACISPLINLEDTLKFRGLLSGKNGLSNANQVINTVTQHLDKVAKDFSIFTSAIIKEIENADCGADVNETFSKACEHIRTDRTINELYMDEGIVRFIKRLNLEDTAAFKRE